MAYLGYKYKELFSAYLLSIVKKKYLKVHK